MGVKSKSKIGDRFGYLTLTSHAFNKDGRGYYGFKCDCGNVCIKLLANLSQTANCGCKTAQLRREARLKYAMPQEHKRVYHIWENMKQRCLNPNTPKYHNYGGRGITICAEWISFKPFLQWALSNGYNTGLTLNRKDNDGIYSPNNCEWITNMEQQSNTRKTVMITHNGETLHLAEWARRSGVHRAILGDRIKRWGDIEKALTTPVKHHGRRSV